MDYRDPEERGLVSAASLHPSSVGRKKSTREGIAIKERPDGTSTYNGETVDDSKLKRE